MVKKNCKRLFQNLLFKQSIGNDGMIETYNKSKVRVKCKQKLGSLWILLILTISNIFPHSILLSVTF